MTQNIEDILGRLKPREGTVRMCLDRSLVGEFEELEAQLAGASDVPESLGDISPARQIAARMEELRERMKRDSVVFRLRAPDSQVWADLYAVQPQDPTLTGDEEADTAARQAFRAAWNAWFCELVAASCVDPVMTAEQADQIRKRADHIQWRDLTDKAWEINTGDQKIPFSDAASALLQTSEQTSGRRSGRASRTRSSSADAE